MNPLGSVFRLRGLGDVISVGDLIKLTSSDMDVTLDTISSGGMSLRYNGCVILVCVEYANKEPFDINGAPPYPPTPI